MDIEEGNVNGNIMLLQSGQNQVAIQAVSLAHAAAQKHAIHCLANFFLGDSDEEAGRGVASLFYAIHGAQRKLGNAFAVSKDAVDSRAAT